MTSKKANIIYGAFGARLRRGPSALAFGHHQLLPVQLLPPGHWVIYGYRRGGGRPTLAAIALSKLASAAKYWPLGT